MSSLLDSKRFFPSYAYWPKLYVFPGRYGKSSGYTDAAAPMIGVDDKKLFETSWMAVNGAPLECLRMAFIDWTLYRWEFNHMEEKIKKGNTILCDANPETVETAPFSAEFLASIAPSSGACRASEKKPRPKEVGKQKNPRSTHLSSPEPQ